MTQASAETVVITGNEAAANAAKLARVQVVAAYPITPQSPVVESLSAWVESGELPAEFVAASLQRRGAIAFKLLSNRILRTL